MSPVLFTARVTALAAATVLISSLSQPVHADGHMPAAMRTVLADPQIVPEAGEASDLTAVLETVYANRGYNPLWTDGAAGLGRARALVDILADARRDGLVPQSYDADGLADALVSLGTDDYPARARLDIRLSVAFVQYITDLADGRIDPKEVDPELFAFRRDFDPRAVLTEAAAAPNLKAFVQSRAPSSANYKRLRDALREYREIAEQGGWKEMSAGETLKPGMRDARVRELRARIAERGDIPAATADADLDLYDAGLEAAVKRFQRRHGLTPDGAVGRNTLAAINVPVADRIAQMVLNMERRRWMPDDLGRDYVFVNIADFELKVVRGPKTVHTARVIVGKSYQRSPVFSDKIRYLEFNPYWNVTRNIARKAILPKLQKNPGVAAEMGYRIYTGWGAGASEIDPLSVDWSEYSRSNFPFRIRQDPGDKNALGQVKFMFPNKHSVYLHDTPSRQLFSRTVRAFSFGCIRVQDPLTLAALLLQEQGWDQTKVDNVVAGKKRKVVTLKERIPVHLAYLTAWANKDGSIHFRGDIYKRDKTLAKALQRWHSDALK